MLRKSMLLIPLLAVLAACGTVATPVFEAELQETRIAEAATSAAETAAAPTATFTVTPSETPLPTNTPTLLPTSTSVPPTNTSEPPTNTPEPTDAPAETTGGEGETVLTGDPVNGQALFQTFVPEANFACNTCHLVDSEAQLIGPGLLNVGIRAATRVEGQTAEEYLHNSILHPSDYVVENYPDMLMPQVYATVFSEDEINDLVAYLFTLQ